MKNQKMTREQFDEAADAMAHDATKKFDDGGSHICISAWNYGLVPSKRLLRRLEEYGFRVASEGVLGYVRFRRPEEEQS